MIPFRIDHLMRVRFGDFTFDSRLRELRSGTELAHLTPKAFRLLEVLLEARPEPVSKEFLYEHLWPKTYVGDTNLKMLVSVLRIALGDDARTPKWVRTVYGFGYAFSEEGVTELPAAAEKVAGLIFRLMIGRQAFALQQGSNIIGRQDDAQVVIDSTSVSRHHAVIVIQGIEASIEDLGSKNGTFIGSRRLEASSPLKDGDHVLFGSVPAVFSAQSRDASTVTHIAG